MQAHPNPVIRFGPFELEARAGELRKHGRRVRLQEQPLQILMALLERPGDLVTREELQHRLWSDGTFVGFDDGLNTAVMRLRDALGDGAESPRYVETLPRRGYRFIGALGPHPQPLTRPAGAESTAAPRATRPGRATWTVGIIAAALLAVLAWQLRRDQPGRLAPIRSIAVLPLENLSNDAGQDAFADAMTDELITSLAGISSLHVISRGSVMQFRHAKTPLPEIGRRLRVDALVEGSVVRDGDRVRVTAQLIEAAADRHLWADSYERDLRDVLTLQREVAAAIAGEIRANLTTRERVRLTTSVPVHPESYLAYIKGRAYWNQRTESALLKGVDAFRQAADMDPNDAKAYAGLALCYTALGYGSYLAPNVAFEGASAAARKALALDPASAESEAALGYVALYYDWHFEDADRRFRHALDLDPASVTAHDWYSVYLTAMGRFDQARTEIRRAQALDPLSTAVATDVGFGAYYAGRYEDAVTDLRSTLSITPNFPLAHLWLGRAYEEQRRFEDAIQEFGETRKVLGEWPVALAAVGHVDGVAGRRADAEAVLVRLSELARRQYVTEYGVALVHAGLGDREAAFAWLDRAVAARSHWLVWLKLDPRWTTLRDDRRFGALLDRIGFTH
jgi:TolB-like protein/DNA-binding winged helix-turn-helix (wHTH) protein/Tfp pilus assembly protein PilF